MFHHQLSVVAGEDHGGLIGQTGLLQGGHEFADDGIRLGTHGEIDAPHQFDRFFIEPVTPGFRFLLVDIGRMGCLVHRRNVDEFGWNLVQPILVCAEGGMNQSWIETDEEGAVTILACTDEFYGPVGALPVAKMIAFFRTRIDGILLGRIQIHHRIRGGVQRFEECGDPVHHRMTAGEEIHMLPQEEHVMGGSECLVIVPHPSFQPLEVVPAFTFVGVCSGEHVGS